MQLSLMPPLPCGPVLAPKARIPTENRVGVRKGIRSEKFAPIINQMDPNSHTPYRLGRRPGQQGPRTQLSDRGWGDKSVTERTNLRQKYGDFAAEEGKRRDIWT